MFKLPDLALGAVIKLYCRSILETSTPDSLAYIYTRASTPSEFLQGRLGCSELLGAVRLTVDPNRLFGDRLCQGHMNGWLLDQLESVT